MATDTDKLLAEIRNLPEEEKLRLVDAILTDLDTTDPVIDQICVIEARKRWEAYKAGRLGTVAYDKVMKNS